MCCLRIGNVAGADALLLNAGNDGLMLDQFASGGFPVRSYIGPLGLARALESLVKFPSSLPHHINLAAPTPVSMKDLAQAAGLAWRPVAAPPNAHESITLDCGALSHIHAFDDHDTSPARMVQEWRELRT